MYPHYLTIVMIRNLIVLDSGGRNLLALNFGECHSLNASPELVSSFISAIYAFSQTVIGKKIKEITFEDLHFMILSKADLIFLISADDDNMTRNRVKLLRIAELFLERYGEEQENFEETGKTPNFKEFELLLFRLKIAMKNCGGRPECEGCPNHRVLPLGKIAKAFQEHESSEG